MLRITDNIRQDNTTHQKLVAGALSRWTHHSLLICSYLAALAGASRIICCSWTEVSPSAAEELLSLK